MYQLRGAGRIHWLSEQEALRRFAAEGDKLGKLFLILDAFARRRDLQVAGHTCHGPDDGGRAAVRMGGTDEATIDLDAVEFEFSQVSERGIAGPEIIHGDPDAEGAQTGQDNGNLLAVFDHGRFSDFDLDAARTEIMASERLGDLAQNIGRPDLDR